MKIGESVRVKGRDDVGLVTIVEFDGNTVYVELKNGCEMDFNKSLLVAPNVIDPKRIVSDDWMEKYIDPTVISMAAIEYDRVHGNKNKPVPWKSLTNEMKMNHVSMLFDKKMDGTRLFEAMQKGIVTKARLLGVVSMGAHNTTRSLKTN